MPNDDLVEVSVLVPRSRLGAFYAAVGEFMSGTAENVEPHPEQEPHSEIAWRPEDGELAYEVVKAGNNNARAIYRVLSENGGRAVSHVDLDAAAGMDGRRRAGLLGAMGRTCWHRKRDVPWKWDSEHSTYTMPSDVASLFRAALERD